MILKRIAALLGTFIFILNVVSAQAANNKKKDAAVKKGPELPIVVEGDQLSFSDLTGDVFAKGNVKITQGEDVILGDLVKGNTKRTEVWVDDKANLLQPGGVNLVGSNMRYNYGSRTGRIMKAAGMLGPERVTGKDIEVFPADYLIHDGTMTRCPAKVPDYHVSADKVYIWPGDKLIAYNAKFWIKDKMIFALPKYQKSLKKNAESDFPGIGYTSKDGFYIRQYLEYPLTDDIAAFAHVDYYTKSKFKPSYGLLNRESRYTLGLYSGNFYDNDGYWIKKEPELRLDWNAERIGNSPVTYTATAIYGKWSDTAKTSWHQDYTLYFSRDPIKLDTTTTLYIGTGYEQVRESFDHSTRNILKFDVTIGKSWTPKLYTWVGYHYTRNNNSLFNYNSTDLGKELASGFSYQIDRLTAISFTQSYDLENHRVNERDYTINRNLHCWQMNLTYNDKLKRFQWDLTTTRW